MKKWFIAFAILAAYAALIWLVWVNDTAMSIARWVCGISLGVFALDWLVGQFAGLFSDRLQEWCAGAMLPISACLLVLFPLFVAVIVR